MKLELHVLHEVLAKKLHHRCFAGFKCASEKVSNSAITCLKLTIETLEKGVEYVQS